MICSKLLKYFLLGTAIALLNSLSVQAGNCMSMGKKEKLPEVLPLSAQEKAQAAKIQIEIKEGFESLKSKSDDWKKAAETFINIFNNFNNFLNEVADKRGGKPAVDGFIAPDLWKKNKIDLDPIWPTQFLKEDIKNIIISNLGKDKVRVELKKGSEFRKYFDSHLKSFLSDAIKTSLAVKKLSQAGAYWEENFIKPVGQLLVNHSQEMSKGDLETLQLLLNLHRCYRGCELIPSEKPYWDNFESVNNKFYNALAKSILNSEDAGEKRNIFFAILRTENTSEIQEKEYLGYSKYNLQIEVLVKRINDVRDAESITPSEDMEKSIAYAQQIANRVTAEKQAEAEGKALRRGAGL